MQPIHELLARIRWDPEFSRSRFELGYWDRVVRELQRVSLDEVGWETGNSTFFEVLDIKGVAHSIPFHRVRKVWRDGVLIWDRDGQLG
jgi:uncharacterized protein (UPF0248 family)